MPPLPPHFACIFSLLLPLLPSKRGVMERNGNGKRKARLDCGRGRKEGGPGKHGKRGPTDPCTLHPIVDMGAFPIFQKLSSLVFLASSARGWKRERESESRVLPMPERRGEEGDLRKLFFRGGKGGGRGERGNSPFRGKATTAVTKREEGKRGWNGPTSSPAWYGAAAGEVYTVQYYSTVGGQGYQDY